MKLTFQEQLIDIIRGAPVSGIVFGETGSPYYQEVPEPPPDFPYVVLNIPESEVIHYTELSYREVYKPEVHVVALQNNISSLSSPYSSQSLIRYLDSLRNNPHFLSGIGFSCEQFVRISYMLSPSEDARSPGGGRVWIATAVYEAFAVAE